MPRTKRYSHIKMKHCPFCSLPQSHVIDSSPLGLIKRDSFPNSLGHNLIIPKRHEDVLAKIGILSGRSASLQSSLAVTRWSYGNGYASGAQAWLKANEYATIDASYIIL